jgi:hypothetical protein
MSRGTSPKKMKTNNRENQILNYVNKQLLRTQSFNISVYMSSLTDQDCKRLKEIGNFSQVYRENIGYVHFWRRSKLLNYD